LKKRSPTGKAESTGPVARAKKKEPKTQSPEGAISAASKLGSGEPVHAMGQKKRSTFFFNKKKIALQATCQKGPSGEQKEGVAHSFAEKKGQIRPPIKGKLPAPTEEKGGPMLKAQER